MHDLLHNFRITLFCVLATALILTSCSNGAEDFSKWTSENQGKPMTPELMEDLISKFGNPIDTLRGADVEIEVYSSHLFLGPHFGIEEGKALFEQERIDREKLFAEYTSLCATYDAGLNSDCPEWETFKMAWEEFDLNYANLYDSLTQGKKTTLGTFLEAYQKRYPGLPENQYLDSLRAFEFRGIADYQIDQLKETRYSFISQSSVSYLSVYGDGSEEDAMDFKVDLYNEVVVLGDGTIGGDAVLGSSYCITDASKADLENHLLGTWTYESGGTTASFTFNQDGTYSYSSSMFDIYKEGEWWINCSGELQNSYGDNHVLTKSGILAGETLYTK